METKVRKRSVSEVLRGHLMAIIFFVAVFGFFIYGISSAERNSASEGRKVLEDNLRKAVVSCYALEGAYPSSVQYLEENYGLTYDKDKYAIGYVAFASNIMPDMQVIELEEGEETAP